MKRKLFITVVLFVFSVVTIMAADINGKWKGKVPSPDGGEMELTFTFKVEADTVLTGTVLSDYGEMPLSKCKINGDEFEYVLDVNGMLITSKGKVTGDDMKITSASDWGESEMLLKRVVE